jgi:hypothetical protein
MKRACGCGYGGVGLGEKYLNTNFEAVQMVAANLGQLLSLVNEFQSPNGTISNAGDKHDLRLDVDIAKLNDLIQMATATEMAGINGGNYAYLNIGGTIKKVPLSLLQNMVATLSMHPAGATMPLARTDNTPLRAGDIWYDSANNQLMTHDGLMWSAVGNRVYEGSVFPYTPRKGDVWWDSDNDTVLLYLGGRWIDVSTSLEPPMWTESATPPTTANGGDRWFDTVNNLEFVYVASTASWIQS